MFFNLLEDEIPLLIIDVNIRPGLKKKINVYDGDTAESLASKFAQEQSKSLWINMFFYLNIRFGQKDRRNFNSINSITYV